MGFGRLCSACILNVLLFFGTAAADELTGEIRGRVSIPSRFQQGLPARMGLNALKVIVDGGAYAALPTADGHFAISGVCPGTHLLQVIHPTLVFEPVYVEAAAKNGVVKMSAHLADFEQGAGAKLKYPLGVAPSNTYTYLEKREEFNIFSIFKSPMALIGLFSFGAMFLLMKVQPMLEEEKERERLRQEAQTGGQSGRSLDD
uniref:ER membrane protein complex subunit 7 beta-sandwich domain-containing protein n=1 Tax=Noctiluca scintillans TaxID=2966 RepID=A0A7S1F4P7_NOCSC|mmetsp:Transcript_34/g.69  ORF Transcript_34/g.69 Transcript_34/m.69 type:complete len:202 (+) Transcript_34:64-669(+)